MPMNQEPVSRHRLENHMLRPRHLTLLAALALGVTACGSDEPDSSTATPPVPAEQPDEPVDEQVGESDGEEAIEPAEEPAGGTDGATGGDALVDAMVADIVGEVDPLTADEGEARCVAQGIVDQIGVDRLAAEGITAETTGDITEGSFSDDEIDSIVGTMFDCVDVQASFAASMVDDVGEEAADCLGAGMTEDFAKRLFASNFSEDEGDFTELLDEFTALYESCGLAFG